MSPATIKQCIDLPPDSAPLSRPQPAHQLWPMSGLFLLDVYDMGVTTDVSMRLVDTWVRIRLILVDRRRTRWRLQPLRSPPRPRLSWTWRGKEPDGLERQKQSKGKKFTDYIRHSSSWFSTQDLPINSCCFIHWSKPFYTAGAMNQQKRQASLAIKRTVNLAALYLMDFQTCGQTYKHFTLVNYECRVIQTGKLLWL